MFKLLKKIFSEPQVYRAGVWMQLKDEFMWQTSSLSEFIKLRVDWTSRAKFRTVPAYTAHISSTGKLVCHTYNAVVSYDLDRYRIADPDKAAKLECLLVKTLEAENKKAQAAVDERKAAIEKGFKEVDC